MRWLNKMFKGIIWSSTLDFPGRIATVLFAGKCNWKCTYCHNKNMLADIDLDTNLLLESLNKRRDSLGRNLNTIVISGGEPSVYGNKMIAVIRRLYNDGYEIGIHTNGSNPKFISKILPYIAFIAMDIKTLPEKYTQYRTISKVFGTTKSIMRSIDIIATCGKAHEFRTTLSKKYVSCCDVLDIAQILAYKGESVYFVQRCNGVPITEQFSDDEVIGLVKDTAKFICMKAR